MKNLHRLLFFALIAGVSSLAGTKSLLAQSSVLEANRNLRTTGQQAAPPGARAGRPATEATAASIDFGNGQSATVLSHKSIFDRIELRHDQTVDIAVQYLSAEAGKTITVEPLDGGQIIAPARNLIVGNDGAIHFKFRAGHSPGIYQVALRNGTQELGLQFWIRDEDHPQNNPPVVNSGN